MHATESSYFFALSKSTSHQPLYLFLRTQTLCNMPTSSAPLSHTHTTYSLILKSPATTHLDLTSTLPALPVPMHSTLMTCPVCFYPTTCSMPILSGKAARNSMVTMTPMLAPACQRCFIDFFQREQSQRDDPSVLSSFPPLLERDGYVKFQVRDQPLTFPFSHFSRAVGSIVALWGKSSRSC